MLKAYISALYPCSYDNMQCVITVLILKTNVARASWDAIHEKITCQPWLGNGLLLLCIYFSKYISSDQLIYKYMVT